MGQHMFDLHTHTTITDGELIPTELVRRMAVAGYKTVAITDHADFSNYAEIIAASKAVKRSASVYGVNLLSGIEITHVPPGEIDELAKLAKDAGADIVVVHGETPVEPVAGGTNLAACSSAYVDILAHPGLISDETAIAAAKNGVALEITSRGGHNRTNGHVFATAKRFGCLCVVDSDSHSPGDIMSMSERVVVARGAGMSPAEAETVLSVKTLNRILGR